MNYCPKFGTVFFADACILYTDIPMQGYMIQQTARSGTDKDVRNGDNHAIILLC